MPLKLKKLITLISDPKEIPVFIIRKFGRKLSRFFAGKAFFVQEQMDINPASNWYKSDFILQTGGIFMNDGASRKVSDFEPWDNTRKDMILLFLRTVIENKIRGDFAEVGVYKGLTARLIHQYAPERKLRLFDTFAGFEKRGADEEQKNTGFAVSEKHFADTSLEEVKKTINPNNNVSFYKGYFPDSLTDEARESVFSFVHLDADLYGPTMDGLKFFYPRMSVGGMILVHDYNAWIGARKAVDEFLRDKKEIAIPMPDKSGSALIVKQ